jgi:Tfp pilus assembly PilM family ATPase
LQDRFEMTCTDLIDDVAATLRYYGAQNGSARVDRMLVSGRFATIDVFIRLLRTRLAVEVEPWNPLAGMPCEGGNECEALMQQVGATMAVATGLAMRSI